MLVKSTISLASGLEIGEWSYTENIDAADIVIVDIEVDGGRDMWERYSHPASSEKAKLVILRQNDGEESKEINSIIRPLTYPKLVKTLKKIEGNFAVIEQTTHPPQQATFLHDPSDITTAPIVPIIQRVFADQQISNVKTFERNRNKSEVTDEVFKPASRLLGLVQDAAEHGKTVLLLHPAFPSLWIFPGGGWFVFDGDIDDSPHLFKTDADEFQLQHTDTDVKAELVNGKLPIPLGILLYRAALYGSEGRLLEGRDRNELIRLSYTPNFNFLPHNSRHLALADYLSTCACTVEVVSKETGIELCDVISFVNACYVINAIETDSADTQAEPHASPITKDEGIDEELQSEDILPSTLYSTKKGGLLESIWSRWSQSNTR